MLLYHCCPRGVCDQATADGVVPSALCSAPVRLSWLRACCAVAEGADVPLSHAVPETSSHCLPDVCVGAVLGDALRRVSVLGGRDGMPRSLASVYGGSVARLLGGRFTGTVHRVIDTPGVVSHCNGVAVSRDGCTLLVSNSNGEGRRGLRCYRVSTGSLCASLSLASTLFRPSKQPLQVCVAPDGVVFVADCGSHRVHMLAPDLSHVGIVGEGQIRYPAGVCASTDVVVVCDHGSHYVRVFRRNDLSPVLSFGGHAADDTARDGRLLFPLALCFLHHERDVAVADCGNDRVSVFGVDGTFIRHVGVGVLHRPCGVASSAYDELVVADTENRCVRVFDDTGELMMTFGEGDFTGVVIHGGMVFAQDCTARQCVLWS
jgi:DNA-binding beta-propeller fold protein YncE